MDGAMRSLLLILVGLLLLLLQSVFSPWLAPAFWSPMVLLPLVIGLAVSPGVTPVHGAGTAFILGYLQDLFTGNPLGVQTFVMVTTFLLAFGVGTRSSFRGIPFQMILTFVLALFAGALVYVLRRMFGPAGVSVVWLQWSYGLFASAMATAVIAPPIFALVRRLDFSARRRSDETAR